MWILGAIATFAGMMLVAHGGLASATGNHQSARWALGRGTVVLVIGMVMFMGVPTANGLVMESHALLVVAAASVAAFVVLMLSEEHPTEGANITQFVTRPARHRPKVANTNRPLLADNRPNEHLQDAVVIEPAGEEAELAQ